jgi:hypothetical protein
LQVGQDEEEEELELEDLIVNGHACGYGELLGIQRVLCRAAEAVFKDKVLPASLSTDRFKARLGKCINTSRITCWVVAQKLDNGAVTAELVTTLLSETKRRDTSRVAAGQSTGLLPEVRIPV